MSSLRREEQIDGPLCRPGRPLACGGVVCGAILTPNDASSEGGGKWWMLPRQNEKMVDAPTIATLDWAARINSSNKNTRRRYRWNGKHKLAFESIQSKDEK